MFPTSEDSEKDLLTIVGKQEAVEAAKEELLKKIKDLVTLLNVVLLLLLLFNYHHHLNH